ncbi:UNVERIFIED_CONTAM: hypothetical protein PYX00_003324 [Menopon gallinae]|uniref:26S proteasome non-ATPase regulatory subunit 8 n=1 Tax=Menopon gallinae TaxID=328185 RepID=A0AAW2I019_9NEOP
MAALKNVISLYENLKTEWSKQEINLDLCENYLNQLKVGLTELMFLPTTNASASVQELVLARNILEIGAFHSIAIGTKDPQLSFDRFERYMVQLKCYYLDYKSDLPESPYKYQLLGLNLLYLLSQNRVAEFHTELELLPPNQLDNPYIRHPVSLEQYLMEGTYNKIFLAKGNVPAQSYNLFMDKLLETIRGEIGTCLEKAYNKISLPGAARMLYSDPAQMHEYANQKKWVLGPDKFYHFSNVEKKTDEPLPALELAAQAIEYARELEMIV